MSSTDVNTNGSCDFPQPVLDFFTTKKRDNHLVTPSFLKLHTGNPKVVLANYDIYSMGKMKGSKQVSYWTKLRILSKDNPSNTIQGQLQVEFHSGHGFKEIGPGIQVMRPTNIQKIITKDTTSFKKRSIIEISAGIYVTLHQIDSLCEIPLMDADLLSRFEKIANLKKREAYARRKTKDKSWRHVSKANMYKENKKLIVKMLIPYMKNLPRDEFFKVFMEDNVSWCLEVKKEFFSDEEYMCTDEYTSELLGNCVGSKRQLEPDPDSNKSSKTVPTSRSIRHISSTDISW